MNACLEMAPLLALAPDEMNDRSLADSLQAHLDTCPSCRERQSLFARMREATRRNATCHAAPLGLHDRVAAALRAESAAAAVAKRPAAAPGRGFWFSLVGGWLAAGAMACLLFVVMESGPQPRRPAAIALADASDAYIDN